MWGLEPLGGSGGRAAVTPYPGIDHPVAIARLPTQIPDMFTLDARIANEPHGKGKERQTSFDVVTEVGSGKNDVRWCARRRVAVKSSPGGV